MDEQTTVAYLRRLVDAFHEERGWEHSPKDLSVSMASELGELMEHFRYRSDAEIDAMLLQPAKRQAVAHEIADLLYHVLALASSVDFDLSAVFRDKMALSSNGYPADLPRGRTGKYKELQERAAS